MQLFLGESFIADSQKHIHSQLPTKARKPAYIIMEVYPSLREKGVETTGLDFRFVLPRGKTMLYCRPRQTGGGEERGVRKEGTAELTDQY